MRGLSTRGKNMYTVMKGGFFGELMIQFNGFNFVIPKDSSAIMKGTGTLKKDVVQRIHRGKLTVKNASYLNDKYGIGIVANQ